MMDNGTFQQIQTLNHQIKNNTNGEPQESEQVNILKSKGFGVKVSKLKNGRSSTSKGITSKGKSKNLKSTSKSEADKTKAQKQRNAEEDEDYVPPRNLRLNKKSGKVNYAESTEGDESSEDEPSEEDEPKKFKRRRGLPRRAAVRAARQMSYAEIYIPSADEFIFCDYPECQDEYYEGCSIDEHEVVYVDEKLANEILEVRKSSIKGADQGAFNNLEWDIPMGVIFGPYSGPIVDVRDYDFGAESGYAWELMDPEKLKVIGYVDPGHNGVKPDPREFIFAYVNSANCKADQNIISVQYRSQIIYRVCQPIPYGKELLTYYGDSYARHLGIKPELYHQGKKKFACKECDSSFGTHAGLCYHINRIHNEIVYPCKLCTHAATSSCNLDTHVRTVHEKVKWYHCNKCDKVFGQKCHANQHFRAIHLGLKPFSCTRCSHKCSQSAHLKTHMRNVHGV